MGAVDLNTAEVTLLIEGKKRVKRFNGDIQEAVIFAKHCRVTLSDGTEYQAEIRIVPPDIYASGSAEAGQFLYEYVFLEADDVHNDGKGNVVHEKRGHI